MNTTRKPRFNSKTEFAEREVTHNGVTFIERNDYAIAKINAGQKVEKNNRMLRLFLYQPVWEEKPEPNRVPEFQVTYDTGYGREANKRFKKLAEARKFFNEMLIPFSEYYVIEVNIDGRGWCDFAGQKSTGRFTSEAAARAFVKNYFDENDYPFEDWVFQYVVRRFYD